jgi:iron(III) transport system substrate-binding protein
MRELIKTLSGRATHKRIIDVRLSHATEAHRERFRLQVWSRLRYIKELYGSAVMKYLIIVMISILWLPLFARAQGNKPLSLADLAVYRGADREELLVTGAKKEGKLVWYTALAGGSYKELAREFQAKYGVQVEVYRGASKDLISKVLAEAEAKKFIMDVAESSPPLMMIMRSMKLLTPYYVSHLGKYLPEAKEETGSGSVYWATDRESYMGFAYNTEKIPANAVPKNYDGLLNPALKGRMAVTSTDTGSRTVGAMLRFKGEEFLRKLRGQDMTMHAMSAQALNELIISGEVEASPTIFRNHVLVAIGNKAPVAWVPMDVVPASAGSSALSAYAPHPHAAVLFLDFIFSSEGQKILESFDYGSAVKDYGFKRWYIERGMTLDQLEKESARWEKALRELVRK